MLDKKLYERYLIEIKENRLNEKELESLTNDSMNLMIQFYCEKKYDEISENIKLAKRFTSLFQGSITSWLSYQIGCFSTIIVVFELLMKSDRQKNSFQKTMTALYEKSGVKEILEYLYMNPDSQHKVICERTSVKNKSYLSQLLKQLEIAGCIERYSAGKRSFFSLSLEGQAFIKEKHQRKKIGNPNFPTRKYYLSHIDDYQSQNIEHSVISKYSKELMDRKIEIMLRR